MKQLLIIAVTLITCNVLAQGQWEKRRDSLLNSLHQSKEDTNRVLTMIRLGAGYLDNQPDSALYYAKAFGELSEKLHYAAGIANSQSMQAMILSEENKQDEAIALNLVAIETARKAKLTKVLANVYNNTAIIYFAKGEYSLCLDYYLKAATIYEQRNDTSSMAFIYGNIAEVYNQLKEYKKGYAHALKGITLCRLLQQTHGLGAGLLNLSTSLINLHRYDTALIVLQDTKENAIKLKDKYEEINVLTNINYAYEGLKKFDLIKNNSQELMAVSKSVNSIDGICFASLGLSNYYLHYKNFSAASHYANKAVTTSKKNNRISILSEAYKVAGRVELERGNIAKHDYFDKLKDSIDETLLSDKILKNTQELEAKYSLNKKQAEIDALNKEQKIQLLTLRQRNIMNWVLAGIVLVMIIIGFLYRINYRQKKKLLLSDALLQQQRITELEKEKQLLAAQAVLQGQVEERTRLAKDLHDGLGGILSSAKYSFNHMKENMIITPENAEAFEKSMGMLDKSISELRRIAHNMMPEALMQFGLDTALKDFCNSIEQSGAIQLTYQSFEMDEASITKTTAAAVYRIIQELVNNILKHANATTALVQLVRKDIALSITVEDNGKGFNKTILQNNDGTGYLNLQNRVTYLNGSIDIQTAADKGTSVNIEISNITV
jgi:two-component system NarL family sensor kinase